MTQIKIDPARLILVPIDELKPNPENRNKHSDDQIDRLVDIIRYQGFRQPIIVSNRSGLIVSGHGRLLAAKKLSLPHVPVSMQDFDSAEEEYAAGVSDNAIASWSELDLEYINNDILNLSPKFNLDLLGMKEIQTTPNFDPGLEIDQAQLDKKNQN
jgi:hypothetical protein